MISPKKTSRTTCQDDTEEEDFSSCAARRYHPPAHPGTGRNLHSTAKRAALRSSATSSRPDSCQPAVPHPHRTCSYKPRATLTSETASAATKRAPARRVARLLACGPLDEWLRKHFISAISLY
ncbi:MAG: hypothetical protein NTX42_06190 [Methanothrix sp.]|nr:hypothetical protein [Methanothrix sp.]